MTSFTDQFGGTPIDPAEVSYKEITIAADYQLVWPPFDTDDQAIAAIIEATASLPGLSILMPEASLGSNGFTTAIRNVGANNVLIKDFSGATIYTLVPGQMVLFYLVDNTTQAGVWQSVVLGAGTSNLDLSNAAGPGLLVVASRLAVSPVASDVAGNRVISTIDRATAFRWTGGAGAFTLPLSSTLPQFFFEVRNQGSGVLTINTTGGETIDGSASITLQLGESCFIHSGTGSWFTVGRGRSTQFAFTQLQKTVTGGTVALTLTEAANVVQTYTGALTSNVDIVVPQVVQVYYVSNQTSGAFNFRVKTALAGTSVAIPTGQNAILFCDGTNVINASTTVAGISSLVLAAGSAASPSLGVGATNSGLYSSGSNEVSVSSNSNQVAKFDTTGLTVPVNNGQISVVSATGGASFGLTRPQGAYGVMNYYTGANQRWRVGVDNAAEGGANAGSDYIFERYNDAGASLGIAFKITRATGAAAFTGAGSFTTSGGNPTLLLTDTGANGSNLKLTGDGGTTPSKTIRVKAGVMEFMSNAYAAIASLTDAGTFTAVNVGISSDRRLKSNIRSTLWSSVWRLLRLRGVRYERGGRLEYGMVAQEVDEVCPELVDRSRDYLHLYYNGLIGELVNSNKLLWIVVAALGARELWRLV